MKKIIYVLVCMMIVSGCRMNSNNDMNSSTTQEKEIAKSNEQQAYTEMNPAWYQSFETGLKNGNITYGSKLSLDPSIVNAK